MTEEPLQPLLQVRNLTVGFRRDGTGPVVRAVDGVSFELHAGETLGLVGESGCGKSVTALSLLRLLPSPPSVREAGEALWWGRDLLSMPVEELRRVRGGKIGMIFQEPMSALSPLHRIGDQLVETARLHLDIGKREARALALDWLRKVGLPDAEQRMEDLPHQLSGGMRQRVMLAMAMLPEPEILLADEPTTALDVTVQAQIFELLAKLRDGKTAVLMITHDMGVVWEVCDRVHVMYAGGIVDILFIIALVLLFVQIKNHQTKDIELNHSWTLRDVECSSCPLMSFTVCCVIVEPPCVAEPPFATAERSALPIRLMSIPECS